MARRKKLENTSLEEQLEYVEQEIRTKESDLRELRHPSMLFHWKSLPDRITSEWQEV